MIPVLIHFKFHILIPRKDKAPYCSPKYYYLNTSSTTGNRSGSRVSSRQYHAVVIQQQQKYFQPHCKLQSYLVSGFSRVSNAETSPQLCLAPELSLCLSLTVDKRPVETLQPSGEDVLCVVSVSCPALRAASLLSNETPCLTPGLSSKSLTYLGHSGFPDISILKERVCPCEGGCSKCLLNNDSGHYSHGEFLK